jgi:catechol 2,3-dioxygenase-like lactoylglutathione lyase family enzyme
VIANARYVHTNLVARDWRRLARFYQEVFGCVVVPPERDLGGESYERGTGVPGARASGVHLLLPGYGPAGPTLEVFQYVTPSPGAPGPADRPGFGHVAFAVPSVPEAREQCLGAGGAGVGEIVATQISAEVVVRWCYVRDPEGNIVELQSREAGAPV